MLKVPFNKPYLTGSETSSISEVMELGKFSGNGVFTKKCQSFFQEKYGAKKALLTSSCTDALEMAAILINIQPGDEVIIPSYTFVSTANPFILRGAKIVFADSSPDHPNLDHNKIENLITSKTKAIVPVHYAGVACNMNIIMHLARKHNIIVIEDAALAIESFYNGKPLGSFGDLSTFSFHETKNIIAGEGGMLLINNAKFVNRSEIVWEKGTNRAAFSRGEVCKYNWVDIGSSFLPSEITAAVLKAQLDHIDDIQARRILIWEYYYKNLFETSKIKLPTVIENTFNNGNMFYFEANSEFERNQLLQHLKEREIDATFHYLPLHSSPFFKNKHDGRELPNADRFSNTLVRLPLFYEITKEQQDHVINSVKEFYS